MKGKIIKYGTVWTFLLLCFIALLLRLYVSKFHTIMVPDYDGLAYIDMAQKASNGQLFSGIGYHPFYPWLLALAHLWVKDYQWAGMVVSMATGSLTVGTLFLFSKALFDFKTGLIPALILIILPLHVLVSTFVFSETTFFLLLSLGMYFGWYTYKNRSWLSGVMTGMAMGVSYLTRPEGALIFAGLIFFLLYIMYKERDKKMEMALLLALTTYLIVVAPYMLYLKREMGHWAISGKVVTNLPDMKNETISQRIGADLSGLKRQTLLGSIIESPYLFLERYKSNLFVTINTFRKELGWSIILLSVVGLLSVFPGSGRSQSVYSVIYPLFVLVPIAFTPLLHPLDNRLIVPYTMFFIIFSGIGVVVLHKVVGAGLSRYWPKVKGIVDKYWITGGLITMLVLFSLGNMMTYRIREHREDQIGYQFKFKWIPAILNKISSPEDLIITREPLQAYYAGRRSINLPSGGVKQVLDYAKTQNASYMVIDRVIIMRKRPLLKPLLLPFYNTLNEKVIKDILGISVEETDIMRERLKVSYVNEPNGIIIYRFIIK